MQGNCGLHTFVYLQRVKIGYQRLKNRTGGHGETHIRRIPKVDLQKDMVRKSRDSIQKGK